MRSTGIPEKRAAVAKKLPGKDFSGLLAQPERAGLNTIREGMLFNYNMFAYLDGEFLEKAVAHLQKGGNPKELAAAGIRPDLMKRGAFTPAELREHERAGLASSVVALRQTEAIRRFRERRRAAALRDVLWCMRQRPLSPQLWAIAAAGLLGPRTMSWLQRLDVRAKVGRAARRYARRAGQA